MDDYIASVEEVFGDRISVVYRQGERDPVGVMIDLPADRMPTREEVVALIEEHAGQALSFWDAQRREETLASRKADLEALLGNVRVAGIRSTPQPQGGIPGVMEI